MTRSVILLCSATFECGDLLSYWVPVLCPVVLVYVLLYCLLGLQYVCFLALEMRFCVFFRVLSFVVLAWALRLNGSFTGLTVLLN